MRFQLNDFTDSLSELFLQLTHRVAEAPASTRTASSSNVSMDDENSALSIEVVDMLCGHSSMVKDLKQCVNTVVLARVNASPLDNEETREPCTAYRELQEALASKLQGCSGSFSQGSSSGGKKSESVVGLLPAIERVLVDTVMRMNEVSNDICSSAISKVCCFQFFCVCDLTS